MPDDIKRKLQGKRARFSRIDMHHIHYPLLPALSEQQKRDRPDVYHPILRKHPKSGRTSLYFGRWACDIEGMPAAEGRALIQWLQEFVTQPRFVYRQVWKVGDAVLWDNRCTQHTPIDDYFGKRRVMHRVTIEGDRPR